MHGAVAWVIARHPCLPVCPHGSAASAKSTKTCPHVVTRPHRLTRLAAAMAL